MTGLCWQPAVSLALQTGVPAGIPPVPITLHPTVLCRGTCPTQSPGAKARHTLLLPSGVPTFVLPAWAELGSWANRLCHAFEPYSGISALDLDSHHPMH